MLQWFLKHLPIQIWNVVIFDVLWKWETCREDKMDCLTVLLQNSQELASVYVKLQFHLALWRKRSLLVRTILCSNYVEQPHQLLLVFFHFVAHYTGIVNPHWGYLELNSSGARWTYCNNKNKNSTSFMNSSMHLIPNLWNIFWLLEHLLCGLNFNSQLSTFQDFQYHIACFSFVVLGN